MWLATRQGNLSSYCLLLIFSHYTGVSVAFLARTEGCNGNPNCKEVNGTLTWYNDCEIERPSKTLFEKYKEGDVEWLQGHFDKFQKSRRYNELERDERSFPAWFAKRMAPNHPPSSMICDGLNSCTVRNAWVEPETIH
jgi:hypothetical protein